jgi:hypothetical protein
MRKNAYAAYDFIRQDKFKTPEKILSVEKLLADKKIVINWWCRQSGKTLTNIKIVRDMAVKVPGTIVLYITPKSSLSAEVTKLIARTIDRSLVSKVERNKIILNNDSIIVTGTMPNSSTLPSVIDKVDLLVVDEFEFIDMANLSQIILSLKNQIFPSLMQRFMSMFKRKKHTRAIFSSSMKDGKNFGAIRSVFSSEETAVTYLNWERVPSVSKDNLVKMLGEETFEKEYNSYVPH